jgi:hypothetical protein
VVVPVLYSYLVGRRNVGTLSAPAPEPAPQPETPALGGFVIPAK